MSWKITLGKADNGYIIGKRWIKKQQPKSNRISKALHSEKSCHDDIYYIGKHFYDNSTERMDLWVCMDSGTVLTKAPKHTKVAPPKPQISSSKPKPTFALKPKREIKPTVKIEKTEPEPEPELKSQPMAKIAPKEPMFSKTTSVSKVKGIGAAVFDKLAAVGINTIDDLLSKHSQEIAAMIGRKSDTQIKTWQETAKEMLG